MKKFVILTLGRAGSNLLCGMLNQHPDIKCHYEVFNNNAIYLADSEITDKKVLAQRDRAPSKFIENLCADAKDYRAFGFKLMFVRDARLIDSCMSDLTFKKIVLKRSNLLAQFSSLKIAQTTGRWTALDQQTREQTRVHFNKIEFLCFLDMVSRTTASLESKLSNISTQQATFLDYVDLLKDETLPRLYRFIDVRILQTTQPLMWKQNTREILDRFDNPASAERCLQDLNKLDWCIE